MNGHEQQQGQGQSNAYPRTTVRHSGNNTFISTQLNAPSAAGDDALAKLCAWAILNHEKIMAEIKARKEELARAKAS